MKKERSFRYVVLRNMAVSYSIILTALGIYMIGLFANFRDSLQEAGTATMNLYVNELQKEMHAVENRVYSLYLQDNMGLSLELARDPMREYVIAYNFYQLFRNDVNGDDAIKAAILLYGDGKSVRFSTKPDFRDEKIQGLKAVVLNGMANQKGNARSGQWLILSCEEKSYLVYVFGKDGVALAEVLDYEGLTSDVIDINQNNDVAIIYTSGQTVLNNNELAEKLGLPDTTTNIRKNSGNGYYIFQHDITGIPLTFYLLLPYSHSLLWQSQMKFTIVIAVITIISVILSYQMFRQKMIRPILAMTKTLERIREDNREERMEENMQLREYNAFGRTFNQMVTQIRELKIQAYEEQIDRDKAKLQALQVQIKPHFYLNSLTALFALSQQKRYDKMEDNILTISDYIRYSFKDSFAPVMLEEELKFVEDTVTIRRDTYNRGIEIYRDVDEQLLGEYVLPLSIQTFVENSMKYANPSGSLAVHIHVSRLSGEDGDYMDIVVSDNGQGYPAEWISRINESQNADEQEHIGIINLKKRLLLQYGEKVEFVIWNCNGAVSEIIYPIESTTEKSMGDKA